MRVELVQPNFYKRLAKGAVLLVLVIYAAAGFTADKTFSARVEAGKSTAIRLDNAGVGTKLNFTLNNSAPVNILVLNQQNYERYPAIEQPLYVGVLDGTSEFTVTPPVSGDYYFVFDNSKGVKPVESAVVMRVSRVNFTPLNNPALSTSMESIVNSLGKLFIFDNIVIEPVSCGFANLLAEGDHIYLCIEYVTQLRQTAKSPEAAKELLMFSILHEMGHVLLRQWGMPFYDNEELADQFATALAGMMGRYAAAVQQADFFASIASSAEMGAKGAHPNRHPLAAQRAKNIRRWAQAGPQHVAAWQAFFIPHMQTRFLLQLQGGSVEWANAELIEKQLTLRGRNSEG